MNRQTRRRDLDVYIDLRSPYSYVAVEPVRAFARELDLQLCWHPYAIDIEAAYGAQDARNPRALRKVKYIYHDARRLGAERGLEIRGPRRVYNAEIAHIGMLFADMSSFLDAYIDAVFAGFFSHAIDIEDRAAMAGLIEELGGSIDEFDAFLAEAGPAELARQKENAEALGIFGVPTFAFAGQIYWGADRLPLLQQRL